MSIITFAPTKATKKEALNSDIKKFYHGLTYERDECITLQARYRGILNAAIQLAESLDEYDDIAFSVNPAFHQNLDNAKMVPVLTGSDGKSDYLIMAVASFVLHNSGVGLVDIDGTKIDGVIDNDDEDADENADEYGYLRYYDIVYKISGGATELLTDGGWQINSGKGITWYTDSQKEIVKNGGAESEFLQALVKAWGPMSDKYYTDLREKFEPLLDLYEKMDGLLRFGASTDEDEGQVFLASAQPSLIGVVIGCYDGQYEVSQYISSDIAGKIVMDSPSSSRDSLNCEDFYNPVGALSFDEAVDYCNKVFGAYVPDGKRSFVLPLSLKKSVCVEIREVDDVREVLLDALDNDDKDLSGEEERARADLREYIDVI